MRLLRTTRTPWGSCGANSFQVPYSTARLDTTKSKTTPNTWCQDAAPTVGHGGYRTGNSEQFGGTHQTLKHDTSARPVNIEPDKKARELEAHLTSRWRWVRRKAIAQLQSAGLEMYERPPRIGLLLAALRVESLRNNAADSLARVLRELRDRRTDIISAGERSALRQSLELDKPQNYAEFIIQVTRMLLRLSDLDAIPHLERLVERTTIRWVTATPMLYREQPQVIRSFEGTKEEVRNMHRVNAAARAALERLTVIMQREISGHGLLRPTSKPPVENLVTPASGWETKPDNLLHTLVEKECLSDAEDP